MPYDSNNASALQAWIDEGKTLLATRDDIRWQLGDRWNQRRNIPELREMRSDDIAEKFFEGRRLSTVQGYGTVAKAFQPCRPQRVVIVSCRAAPIIVSMTCDNRPSRR